MKVFLSSDMEGTAGVVAWEQCVGDGYEAVHGRRLLLAELRQRRVPAAEDQPAGVVRGLPVSGKEQGHTGHTCEL